MRIRGLVLAALLAPALVSAQSPLGGGGNDTLRLRDRYKSPQNNQKLDDTLRRLRSDDVDERLTAVRALGDLSGSEPKATEYLIAATSDPDMRVRIKAIDTLGLAKVKDATPILVQQLFMRDTDVGTKRRILAALGKIADPRATQPIIDFMSRDVDPAARGTAIYALGDIGDPVAVPALEAIAGNGDAELSGLAREAARKIRERPQPGPLVPALVVDQARGNGRPSPQ
jgi:HEAT repeat protein